MEQCGLDPEQIGGRDAQASQAWEIQPIMSRRRILLGSLEDPTGSGVGVLGLELEGTVVASF